MAKNQHYPRPQDETTGKPTGIQADKYQLQMLSQNPGIFSPKNGQWWEYYEDIPVNWQLDPENHPFLVVSLIFQPLAASKC